MTVRELIMELAEYPPDDEVVIEGTSWVGASEPEHYDTEPTLLPGDGKVRIIA
jgi:hypothetical protein